jgi:hypothetical protein
LSQRDTVERARDVAGVIDQYTKFVKPMFEQFVLPSKKVSPTPPPTIRFPILPLCLSLCLPHRPSHGVSLRLHCVSLQVADIIIPWARGNNVVAIDLIVQHILTKLGQHDLRRIYPTLDILPGNYQVMTLPPYSDLFVANRTIRVWQGATENEWPLHKGKLPISRGVRVHVSAGYNRVEGNRRASRNGLVGDFPPKSITSRSLYAAQRLHLAVYKYSLVRATMVARLA